MATLFHVYLRPKNGVTSAEIEKKLNLALDWFKYGEYCWIVESTSDTARWQTRMKPLVEPDGSFFICKIDSEIRQGWMAKTFWNWLRGKK